MLFNGSSSPISIGSTVAPPAPTGLSQFGVGYTDGVTISWQAAPGASGYVIEWSNGSEWFAIDETDGTSYTDEYPTIGSQQYRVVAYRGNASPSYSAPSAPLSVTPIAPPVAWYDDNAGANSRGTLSPFSVIHDDQDGLPISVIPNDLDYDSSDVVIANYEQPENGTLNFDEETGQFTYFPADGFVGTDTFTYTVTDGYAESQPATVAIDVTNEAPTVSPATVEAVFDYVHYTSFPYAYEIVERSTEGHVTAEDADEDDEANLTYTLVEAPEFGEVELDDETGEFSYHFNSDFQGFDRFVVSVSDGIDESIPQPITITSGQAIVSGIGAMPSYTAQEGFGAVGGHFTDVRIAQQPQHGSIVRAFDHHVVGSEPVLDALYRYRPDQEGGTAPDSFVVSTQFGAIEGKPYTVHAYTYPNEPSVNGLGGPVVYEVAAGRPTTIGNAVTRFLPGPPFAVSLTVTSPTEHGNLNVAADGSFTYTPDSEEEYVGWDFFELKATNAAGEIRKTWVQLYVGIDGPTQAPSVPELPPEPEGAPAVSSGSGYFGARDSVREAEQRLKKLLEDVGALGKAKAATNAATTPEDVDEAISAQNTATGQVEQSYDGYLNQLEAAQSAMAEYLPSVWITSYYTRQLTAAFNLLPTSVGSIKASKEHLEKLLSGADVYGDAAAVLIANNTATIQFAESSRDVLTIVSAGGSTAAVGGRVLFALGSVAYREGFRAFAKSAAATALRVSITAGAGHLSQQQMDKLNLSAETKTYLSLGFAAFQSSKAVKIFASKIRGSVHPLILKYRDQHPRNSLRGQTLGLAGNSTVLRHNLKAAGVNDPEPGVTAAHHIVAWGRSNLNAARARAVLDDVGIDINEASNGVYLPVPGKGRIDGGLTRHPPAHTNDYYEIVADRLEAAQADGASAVRTVLSNIRKELLHGTFPYP